ncbi:hypothetical protein [Desulfotalea psychrophila]|uniref:Lipoprotein n=1 Tax=Desulfotalea psychrophila (strain LSv54 / DSM 12343) TaxID=177439 RepID=Q6ARQ2_DESPS|nr:hypothetical protein [Desulfotalea psychrophila]CAG34973.1 conserved hypothetical protein [Desulfotalea psychrophila LSv54]
MKKISVSVVVGLLGITLYGCASVPLEKKDQLIAAAQSCLGSVDLPEGFSGKFELVEDAQLLGEALGAPNKGKLCQGRVYKSNKDGQIIIYRAWNSTNPNSKFGKWWAFQAPTGEIAQYRSGYEICYQWSPLDTLVSCTLKPESKVVVGTGQSAECSEYLSYPVSARQQIYIEDASASVTDCITLKGEFSWK